MNRILDLYSDCLNDSKVEYQIGVIMINLLFVLYLCIL